MGGNINEKTYATIDTLTDVLTFKASVAPASVIRWLSIMIILLMLCTYIAAQLAAAAKSFEAFYGWSNLSGATLGTGMIFIYTMLGGFRVVAWADVLQALLMLSAILILPLVLVDKIGGFDAL